MTRRTRTLTALAMVALTAMTGCSGESEDLEAGRDAAMRQTKALRFAECMRDNGVSGFPDPDASGALTIDGVLNGSGLDPSGAVWQGAMAACEHLQPPGFTGDEDVTADEQEARLEFAECMRDNGVGDFPDPADGEPLVDTNRIPSSATESGMAILDAAMQTCGEVAPGVTGGE